MSSLKSLDNSPHISLLQRVWFKRKVNWYTIYISLDLLLFFLAIYKLFYCSIFEQQDFLKLLNILLIKVFFLRNPSFAATLFFLKIIILIRSMILLNWFGIWFLIIWQIAFRLFGSDYLIKIIKLIKQIHLFGWVQATIVLVFSP